MGPSHNYTQTCGTVVPRYNTDPEIRHLCNGGRKDEEDMEDGVGFSSTREQENAYPSSRHLMGNMEDMEVDEEVPAHGGLLPSSVLDNGREFSEQFARSFSRRSSLGVDGSFDLGCSSSRSESRRSSLSCSAETCEKDKEFRRSTPEPVKETSPFRPDQRPQKKQDTLSKKERILIRKIRRYYEHAEHQDSGFAIKRRESLSYIPAGLVRNLSRQLNDLTSDEDVALRKKASSIARPTSWDVFSLPGLDSESRSKACSSKTQNGDETFSKDEEFHPAPEVVKMWQEIEGKSLGSSEEHQDSLEGTESSCTTTPDQEKRAEISKTSSDSGLGEPLLILEESDEGSTPSKVDICSEKDKSPEFKNSPNQERKIQERHKVNHSPLPRIISLRSANEEDLVLQDMEKMKNKVFQLARKYSQRIKNSRPVVRQRPKVTESHFIPKSLSCVIEEKPSGKTKGG